MTNIDDQAGTCVSAPGHDGPDPASSTIKAISATWTCPSCNEVFAGSPPEHRLCGDCLAELESAGYEPAPGAPYGDLPPCPDCGGQMVEVVPVGDLI